MREATAAGVVFSIDHHRGSEEHQPGQQYHDRALTDPGGRVDTLGAFRTTIEQAGLGEVVVGIVAASEVVGRTGTPLGMVFIDGGHSSRRRRDLELWSPHVIAAIHDVFPDPAEQGTSPFEIYRRALDSGRFEEAATRGSLRILRRRAAGHRAVGPPPSSSSPGAPGRLGAATPFLGARCPIQKRRRRLSGVGATPGRARFGAQARDVKGEDELRGLTRGHPGPIRHTPHAATGDDETLPAFLQPPGGFGPL